MILDPFSGSGSTVAAAMAVGLEAIGVERYRSYFDSSATSVPALAKSESKADELLGIAKQGNLYTSAN